MSIGQTIKRFAVDAVEAGGPLQFIEGEVVSEPPDIKLRLKNNPKLIIPSDFIQIAEHLQRHKRRVNIEALSVRESMSTEGHAPHTHDIQTLAFEDAEMEFIDELEIGEKVMVAAVQGGQSFFIIDRLKE